MDGGELECGWLTWNSALWVLSSVYVALYLNRRRGSESAGGQTAQEYAPGQQEVALENKGDGAEQPAAPQPVYQQHQQPVYQQQQQPSQQHQQPVYQQQPHQQLQPPYPIPQQYHHQHHQPNPPYPQDPVPREQTVSPVSSISHNNGNPNVSELSSTSQYTAYDPNVTELSSPNLPYVQHGNAAGPVVPRKVVGSPGVAELGTHR